MRLYVDASHFSSSAPFVHTREFVRFTFHLYYLWYTLMTPSGKKDPRQLIIYLSQTIELLKIECLRRVHRIHPFYSLSLFYLRLNSHRGQRGRVCRTLLEPWSESHFFFLLSLVM